MAPKNKSAVAIMVPQAAELTGSSVTQFIVQSAYQKAQEVIERERIIRLTVRSATTFFEALDQPPETTENLKKAAKALRERRDAIENRTP